MVQISVIKHLAALSLTLRKPCQEKECYQSGKHDLKIQSRRIIRAPEFLHFARPGSIPTKITHIT